MMVFLRKLPIPQEIKQRYPVTEDLARCKSQRDRDLRDVFTGTSDKFILVIGPCSADRQAPILHYIERLKPVADEVRDRLIIVPRVYTNKPRTTGLGYMGMLHQPDPTEAPDLLKGLIAIRETHLTILREFGMTCADELLYPDNYRYLSDLLSYATVGARSVENQYHRLVSSGLDIPVGMKNPISGDLTVMLNSVRAAKQSHAFLYRGWEVVTQGNPLTHGVLRGYKDAEGHEQPNYSYDTLCRLTESFAAQPELCCPLLIDTNHANSGKQYEKQPEITMDVLRSRRGNAAIRQTVKGLMIESYLLDGAQSPDGTEEGMSITDPCLGWDKTKDLILRIAEQV